MSSDKDEVCEIAAKGGKASHSGGFASMDPDKQVSQPSDKRTLSPVIVLATLLHGPEVCR